jgi:carbonic anhydrase
MFSRAALLSSLAAAPMGAFAASEGAAFSYDPNVETGPAYWGDLKIEGNVCNGKKNSPIAVKSMSCTQFEDYKFTVSTLISLLNLPSKARRVSDSGSFPFMRRRTENAHSRT